jgi:hypothetical protein
VRIGVGHDAGTTAFSTFYGTIDNPQQQVWINPETVEQEGAAWTTQAVSTASS